MSPEQSPLAIVRGTLIDGTGNPPVKDSVVLVKDGLIIAVGERGEVEIQEGAEIIEASGMTVLPGLIDAHTHFLWMGLRMMRTIDLSDTRSIEETVEKVRRKLEETKKGEWMLGRGWDDSKWEERRFVNKWDLDPFSPDNPVVLTRICGHMVTLNSRALEIAGITRETPNPIGGQIDKGDDGEPTGVLRDARQLINPFIPLATEGQVIEGIRRACDHALSLGCTGIHDAGLRGSEIKAYQDALEQGVLKIRVTIMWRVELSDSMEALGFQTGFGNEMIRLGPAKLFIDGSLGARTAALFDPYEDDPSTKGLLMMPAEKLNEKVKRIHRLGSQVAVHAIGDYGIELAINAVEEALRDSPRKDHRHRIEHCEILSSSQIERIKQLSIVASVQPNFVCEWSGPDGLYEARLGKRRLRQNNPYRALLDEGVRIPFGSDCIPLHPLYGIHSAVNHPIRNSRISLEEAVKGYTLDAAYASFEEDLKGSVESGKLADIVILERDLTEVQAQEIKDIPVYMTIIGGKILYSRS
ncbi:MAG: amidohydrolase [Candidatus Bathyarchaeota archaeon]|nr:MAG: amidohydrolase [Candidatus Bathyarchaeota archaeon]